MMARTRQSGWWYPWIFVGGMLIVIAVNGVMFFFAIDTFPGLDTDDHYRKGLAYNSALEGADAQNKRGWRMDLSFTPHSREDKSHGGELTIILTDRNGQPLRSLAVEAELIRPTHEGFDTAVVLSHLGGGQYAGEVDIPLPGQWEARIHAHGNSEDFQASRRIIVP